MLGLDTKEKQLEVVFIAVFSALILALFFSLLGGNGLVLGNDSAVHLQRAQHFLNVGKIGLSEVAWYPPLYHLVLSTLIAFTGASNAEQLLFVMKALTAIIDWLLVISVYLVAAKYFNKKTGVIAGSLMLLCFPLYEINFWGGYTTILALLFMALAFLYLALPNKGIGGALVTAVLAFSVVMSHDLATFLAVFILPPFIIMVLVRSKGHYPKALLAALVGAGIAIGIYYVGPILPYLGDLVFVFFQMNIYTYQISSVSFNAFMMNFGFILFFALAGLVLAFVKLRRQKSLGAYLLLAMAFLVPLVFSQLYLVGVLFPFSRLVGYMMPWMVIFAALSLTMLLDGTFAAFFNRKKAWRNYALKALAVGAVVVLVAFMVVRMQTVSGRVEEGSVSYSYSNLDAYQAGDWIKKNFPDQSARIVLTQKPGIMFSLYSGKQIIAQTDPIVEWNNRAECVLDLSYEMEHPLTLFRAYEAAVGNDSEDNFVSKDMVWTRATYVPLDNAYLSFRDESDSLHQFWLSTLDRAVYYDNSSMPKKVTVKYSAVDFELYENVLMGNESYPLTVTWELHALGKPLNYAKLYVSYYFDQRLSFKKAYVPGALDWQSPWDNPSKVAEGSWAITDFYGENMTGDVVAAVDEESRIGFGVKFLDLPDFGNLGALGNGNVDAIRFHYQLYKVDANSSYSVSYQVLAFAGSSYPQMEDLTQMNELFDLKVDGGFAVRTRDFASIVQENYICFIVYDSAEFSSELLRSRWLQLVYSNNGFVVCKISTNHR